MSKDNKPKTEATAPAAKTEDEIRAEIEAKVRAETEAKVRSEMEVKVRAEMEAKALEQNKIRESEVPEGSVRAKLYSCEIRLGGSVMHTQFVDKVTQREMKVLRHLHGSGGVANVKETGEAVINETVELYQLAINYSKTLNPLHGKKMIEDLFKVDLEGFDAWNLERMKAQDERREEVQQVKNIKSARLTAARNKAEAEVNSEIAEEERKAASKMTI